MWKLSTLFAAAVVLASTSAMAADTPSKQDTQNFSWTGVYAGLNVGYGWGDTEISVTQNPSPAVFGGTPFGYNSNPKGGLIGGQMGYNIQTGSMVVGVEGDFQLSALRDTGFRQGLDALQTRSTSITETKLSNFATLRGRIGFSPVERLMVYGTGGLMLASVSNTSATQYAGAAFNAAFRYEGSDSATKLGWIGGGGFEYALSNNITTKFEYLYYDLGRQGYPGARVAGVNAFSLNYDTQTTGNIVRLGINYKF
jgi:outer membrane immunogenic protein